MSSYLCLSSSRSDPIFLSVGFLRRVCVSFRLLRCFGPPPCSCVFLSTMDLGWMDLLRVVWIEPTTFVFLPPGQGSHRVLVPPFDTDPFLQPMPHRRTEKRMGPSILDRGPTVFAVFLCGTWTHAKAVPVPIGATQPRFWWTNTRHNCVERHGRCIERDEWNGCTRAGRWNGRIARDPTQDGCVMHENADRPRRVGSEIQRETKTKKKKNDHQNKTMDNSHVEAKPRRKRKNKR